MPFDGKNPKPPREKLEKKFSDLVKRAEEIGPSFYCQDCDEYKNISQFKKESFIENWGDLVCDDCFD